MSTKHHPYKFIPDLHSIDYFLDRDVNVTGKILMTEITVVSIQSFNQWSMQKDEKECEIFET